MPKNNRKAENSDSKTLLLVEDEALIAMAETQLLTKHGYEVIKAHNAEKAIEKVENNHIDLVLMDIDLGPGQMDGTEAAQKILEEHDMPIVFLTGHAEKEYVDRVKKITGYGYVLKNSGEFVLIESIHMAFHLFEANKRLKKENEERKRVEEALREEEAELSAIYEHTPVLMIIVDRERRVRKANAFATEFAGAPAEELIGKRGGEALRCVHHLDDPKGCGFGPYCDECKVRRTVMASFERRKSFKKLESTLPFFRNGTEQEITFLLSTSFLEIRGEHLVIVSIEDISERKELERKLHESKEQYKTLYENAPFPYQSLNENGEILFVNSEWLGVLGYKREEVLGKWFGGFLHPDNAVYYRACFKQFKERGTIDNITFKLRKKNGEYIDALFKGRIGYTEGGAFKQTHCIFKYITENTTVQL